MYTIYHFRQLFFISFICMMFQKQIHYFTLLYFHFTLLYLLTYWTYLLTYSMEQSLSWEANRFSASHKFPAFHGTRRFITAVTSARYLSLCWASLFQPISPHPTSRRSILIFILPSMTGSPKWSLSLWFPTQNPVHTFRFPHTCYMSKKKICLLNLDWPFVSRFILHRPRYIPPQIIAPPNDPHRGWAHCTFL